MGSASMADAARCFTNRSRHESSHRLRARVDRSRYTAEEYQRTVDRLNRRIDAHNLKVPVTSAQKLNIRVSQKS